MPDIKGIPEERLPFTDWTMLMRTMEARFALKLSRVVPGTVAKEAEALRQRSGTHIILQEPPYRSLSILLTLSGGTYATYNHCVSYAIIYEK